MTKEEVSQDIRKFLAYLQANGVNTNTCVVVVHEPDGRIGVHAFGSSDDCKDALLILLVDEQVYKVVPK